MSGEPSYVELGVPDVARALTFYSAVLGWSVPPGAPMAQVDTGGLGIGIHGGDPSALFEVFFAVADLDAAIASVTSAGGQVPGEIQDNPGFGRWVECVDDQGVRFGLREA